MSIGKPLVAALSVPMTLLLVVLWLIASGHPQPLHAAAPAAPMSSIPPATYTQIAAGHDHTCALTTEGAVHCWGDNADGQVGDGSDFPSRPPTVVAGLAEGVTAIVTGGNHSCALRTDGALRCWGRNSNGQLGDGTTDEQLIPVTVTGLSATPTALAAGDGHTCALLQDGSVTCWGRNDHGQIGDGTTTERLLPTPVTALGGSAVEITAGYAHTCARLSDGSVRCWGQNGDGQLGNDSLSDSSTPVTVSGLSRSATALTAGFYHTCAVLSDGDVECWGDNARGQLGDETRDDRRTPVAVRDLSDDIAALAAGRYHTCALAIDGDVHCWGSSSRGQLGTGSLESSRTPVRLTTLGSDAIALAAGEEHTCAILQSNAVRCWGSNRDRQLGDGAPGSYSVPQFLIPERATGALTPLNRIPQIAAGRYHACLITPSRGVQCWGRNSDGQLGDGTELPRSTPTNVVGLERGVVGLALGAEHSCALRQDGTVACWGSNQYGQLGDGTAEKRLTPVIVSGLLGNVAAIAAGDNHTCAVLQGGTVHCWGQNSAGQLGDGTTTDSSFPVDVLGLSGVTALAAGTAHSCALAQGSVTCWGNNESGQLGDGSQRDRSTPTAVAGLPAGTVGALTAGDRHTCVAVEAAANGGVYCWGNNRDGQLGNGAEEDSATPVAVEGISTAVRQLGAGASHSCGLTTANALYCWGGNEQSQLGDGTTEDRTTAAIVSGLTANVLALAGGGYHNCVLVPTNRPLCWGNDSDGQLASGVAAQRTMPVALGDGPSARIDFNVFSGQPGSTFTLIGGGFPADAALPVVVNGTPLTETINVNPSGEFILYLTSGENTEGTYEIQIGEDPAVRNVILLQPQSEARAIEGGGTTIALPDGSGEAITTLYLPLVAQ